LTATGSNGTANNSLPKPCTPTVTGQRGGICRDKWQNVKPRLASSVMLLWSASARIWIATGQMSGLTRYWNPGPSPNLNGHPRYKDASATHSALWAGTPLNPTAGKSGDRLLAHNRPSFSPFAPFEPCDRKKTAPPFKRERLTADAMPDGDGRSLSRARARKKRPARDYQAGQSVTGRAELTQKTRPRPLTGRPM